MVSRKGLILVIVLFLSLFMVSSNFIPQASASTQTFGRATTAGNDGYFTFNYYALDVAEIFANKFTCTYEGNASTITVYLAQYGANNPIIKTALYTDNETNNIPNSLLGATDEWTITDGWDGWKTFNLTSEVPVNATTDYWIAIWGNNVGAEYRYQVYGKINPGVGDGRDKTGLTYDGFPDPYPTDATYTDDEMSIYVTYRATDFTATFNVSDSDGLLIDTRTINVKGTMGNGTSFDFNDTDGTIQGTVAVGTMTWRAWWGSYILHNEDQTQDITQNVTLATTTTLKKFNSSSYYMFGIINGTNSGALPIRLVGSHNWKVEDHNIWESNAKLKMDFANWLKTDKPVSFIVDGIIETDWTWTEATSIFEYTFDVEANTGHSFSMSWDAEGGIGGPDTTPTPPIYYNATATAERLGIPLWVAEQLPWLVMGAIGLVITIPALAIRNGKKPRSQQTKQPKRRERKNKKPKRRERENKKLKRREPKNNKLKRLWKRTW